jgi:hypothetical protein
MFDVIFDYANHLLVSDPCRVIGIGGVCIDFIRRIGYANRHDRALIPSEDNARHSLENDKGPSGRYDGGVSREAAGAVRKCTLDVWSRFKIKWIE